MKEEKFTMEDMKKPEEEENQTFIAWHERDAQITREEIEMRVELPKDFDFRNWIEENKDTMILGISFDKNSKHEWQLRTVDLAKYPSLVKERLIYGLTHILANLKKD